MPKFLIMYNLKDDLKEEDFVLWVHEFKGPFISGLSAVKSYTLTKAVGAIKAEGGPPGPADPPYTMIGIVDRLEKTGLVERTPNPDDRRSILIRITEKGAALTDELKGRMLTANQEFLASLSHEEETMLRGLLQRLMR